MTDYEKIKQNILERRGNDISALRDCLTLCAETQDHSTSKIIRMKAAELVKSGGGVPALELFNQTLLFDAPVNFDCFMRYLEHKRPKEEQFWLPRRDKLMCVCKALQDLGDNNLDELFLSMPPRVGKSTIVQFYLLMQMGRNTERSNLYCSFTAKPVNTFYDGLLEVLQDRDTYAYYDIFPNAKIVTTNALDGIIDLQRKKKYPSFTGRPIGGSLNGSCDCDGLQIGDDLCGGIEEAVSPSRMQSLELKVENNFLTRGKPTCKKLWIGTRWSVIDPQGVRLDTLTNEPHFKNVRWKLINIPALNEKEESNFDFKYGKGFPTTHFLQVRASFERNSDMASWLAQYQGEPIMREGAVFDPAEMRYYNGVLPPTEPDRVFMVVDPSWGGGDYTAAPVVVQYGYDLYVPEVVFCDKDKTITQPMIVGCVKRNNVTAMKIEATKTTMGYGEDIDNALRKDGIKLNLTMNTSHFTGAGKRDRIIASAPDIRTRMIFLQDGCRSKDYQMFMQNMYTFTYEGNIKHDDAPDACAMVIDYVDRGGAAKVTVISSPFNR